MIRFVLTILALCLITSTSSRADVRFASPFTDHMVLQRNKTLEIRGTADANAAVDVQLDQQKKHATAGADGIWKVTLEPMQAGGPFELTAISSASTATVHDILIGDVWLCSGQSNMQFSLGECEDGAAMAMVSHPKLRLGKVGQAWTKTPQASAKINWTVADAENAKHFSAVAYMFAHELENDPAMKDVPIGLLEDCLGGTVVESWLPKSALAGFDEKELQSSMFGIGPTLLYNAMIAPLGASSFTGVIWYQGEGNAGQPVRYEKLLPLLFKNWREQFGDPTLPFIVVQLPDFATDWDGIYWQWIREAEAKSVAQTPNTPLCVSINTNDGWDLHPQGKHEISRRLALLARQDVYHEKIVGKGPVFKSAKVDGDKMIVDFDADGGTLTAAAGPVEGFMLAGEDGVYHAASAVIDGDSVIVTSTEVSKPATVRYAWAGVPMSNLSNGSEIPAAPFRTDTQMFTRGRGEAQRQPQGFVFKGKDYQATISAEGRFTSLIVHNQQLLSNAPDSWGGGGVTGRTLSHLKLLGPDIVVCSNNETSFTIHFQDDQMTWTIDNHHPKDPAIFHLALTPLATAAGTGSAETVKRKNAELKFTGVDHVITYRDIAADDGKVLETTVAAGQSKVIEVGVVK